MLLGQGAHDQLGVALRRQTRSRPPSSGSSNRRCRGRDRSRSRRSRGRAAHPRAASESFPPETATRSRSSGPNILNSLIVFADLVVDVGDEVLAAEAALCLRISTTAGPRHTLHFIGCPPTARGGPRVRLRLGAIRRGSAGSRPGLPAPPRERCRVPCRSADTTLRPRYVDDAVGITKLHLHPQSLCPTDGAETVGCEGSAVYSLNAGGLTSRAHVDGVLAVVVHDLRTPRCRRA